MVKMAAGEKLVDGMILGDEMASDGVCRADFVCKSVQFLQRVFSWAFLGPERAPEGGKMATSCLSRGINAVSEGGRVHHL